MTNKTRYWIYIDNDFVYSKEYAWPISRLMTYLRQRYPDAKVIEVDSLDRTEAVLRSGN